MTTTYFAQRNDPEIGGFSVFSRFDGIVCPLVTDATFDEAVAILRADDVLDMIDARYEASFIGCECEQDWNCGLHRNRVGTWLETRYDGLED